MRINFVLLFASTHVLLQTNKQTCVLIALHLLDGSVSNILLFTNRKRLSDAAHNSRRVNTLSAEILTISE